jgi:hypothetical protein
MIQDTINLLAMFGILMALGFIIFTFCLLVDFWRHAGILPRLKNNLRVEFIFSVQEKKDKNQTMTTVKLTTVQQVSIAAVFEASNGQPVNVVGTPVWASADPNIATVTPAADGLSAVVASVGPGSTTVTVTGEGDPTPGVDTVTGSVGVEVVAAEATQVVLNVGTPTDKTVV